MKGKKFWKTILFLLLIIFLLLLILTLRKFIIIDALNNKYNDNFQNANLNVYMKHTDKFSHATNQIYKKDDTVKRVMSRSDSQTIQMLNPEKELTFYDTGKKKVSIYDQEYDANFEKKHNYITNYLDTGTFFEKIVMSIFSKISITNVDGKECYKIDKSLFLYIYVKHGVGSITKANYYIEKETGLPLKVKIIENSKDETNITYKYNIVTDDDLKSPDISEYVIE